MKLRYYLRGLGLGILVTAFIMGIGTGGHKQMSDEEVKLRAKELGMVESTTLSNLVNAQEQETVPNSEETEVVETGESLEAEPGDTEAKDPGNVEPVETKTEETEPAETNSEETELVNNQSEETEVQTISITIRSGESSVSVSRSLSEAGLVDSASDYDSFLCSNGYDKRIKTGTYHIPVGTSKEDIAKVITGKLSFD